MLSAGESSGFRQDQRAYHILLLKYFTKDTAVQAAGDYSRNTRRRRLPRRAQLGRDSPCPDAAETLPFDRLSQPLGCSDQGNELSIRIGPWILIVNSLDIAENHQQIRFQKGCHQRRQMIVVAEFHFFDSHRVILIDDGNDCRLQYHLKSMLSVVITLT